MEREELEAAQRHFDCVSLLTDIHKDDFVIPRYSLYPFPADQEREIRNIGAKIINTYDQHLYIADLGNYVPVLGDLTPRTWDDLTHLPENTSFVLKGETNSRKNDWNNSMFALDKTAAIKVHSRLLADGLIGSQKIYIREYVPLKKYLTGIGGMPITKEFRFFVAYGRILCGEYYWQNYIDDLEEKPNVNDVPFLFLQSVIDRIKDHVNFFVIDVAERESGGWIVIELNDGSQSGLSCNNPELLYSALKQTLVYKGV